MAKWIGCTLVCETFNVSNVPKPNPPVLSSTIALILSLPYLASSLSISWITLKWSSLCDNTILSNNLYSSTIVITVESAPEPAKSIPIHFRSVVL